MTTASTTQAPALAEAVKPHEEEPLTMYLFVRKDLHTGGNSSSSLPLLPVYEKRLNEFGAPSLNSAPFSILTQASHATTLALTTFAADPSTLAYTSPANLPHMHTVSFAAKDAKHLEKCGRVLREKGVDCVEWVEMPEGVPTALATRPYRRSEIANALKACRVSLYR